MSTLDGDLPGHDDMDDSDDMDFVRDLMDKFQAVEDAGHRLAEAHARRIVVANVLTTERHEEGEDWKLLPQWEDFWGAVDTREAILYLTERCGATYDAETRTLRMPKE